MTHTICDQQFLSFAFYCPQECCWKRHLLVPSIRQLEEFSCSQRSLSPYTRVEDWTSLRMYVQSRKELQTLEKPSWDVDADTRLYSVRYTRLPPPKIHQLYLRSPSNYPMGMVRRSFLMAGELHDVGERNMAQCTASGLASSVKCEIGLFADDGYF